MAIKSKEELMQTLRARVGEDSSDETLAFIEDVSDTFDDLETRTHDSAEWERRYNENDSAWRKRYRDRFYNTATDEDDKFGADDKPKVLSYDDLFKEGD